jgi:hypothetical protein
MGVRDRAPACTLSALSAVMPEKSTPVVDALLLWL